MDHTDWLDEQFEQQRTHLRAVAYRMLGSLSDADDAVQEAWLRFSRSDTSDVENLKAWLTTVVARVSLDMLRSRQTRREDPLAAAHAGSDHRPPRWHRPRARGTAGRLGRRGAAGGARNVEPARAAGLRPARHLRRARSTRSRPSSTARPKRPASWPAGPVGGCRASRPCRTRTSSASVRWSTPSWPRPGTVTSTRCWRCSTPTSSLRADEGRSGSSPGLARSVVSLAVAKQARAFSMRGFLVQPALVNGVVGAVSFGPTAAPSRSGHSRCAATRSSPSTSWPTPSDWPGSTSPCSTADSVRRAADVTSAARSGVLLGEERPISGPAAERANRFPIASHAPSQ